MGWGRSPGTGQVGAGLRVSDLHPLGYDLLSLETLVSKGHSHFEALPLTDLKQLAFALSSWVSTDTLTKSGFKPLQDLAV